MRTILLGTTALVGAMLVSQAAFAQLEVNAGGKAEFTAGFWDESRTNANDREFEIDAEVMVLAAGTAANGLQYGAEIQIETNGSRRANTDEAFLFLTGSWGRIELGDEDAATAAMTVYSPSVGIFQTDGAYDGFIGIAPSNFYDAFQPNDGGDETKVTYFTPRIAGFQIGVSYIPDLGGNASEGDADRVNNTDPDGPFYSDVFAAALNYEGEFSGVEYIFSTGIVYGSNDTQPEAPDVNDAVDDYVSWSVGMQFSYAGFTLGGSYVNHGDFVASFATDSDGPTPFDSDIDNFRGFNIGLSWEQGPISVAGQYARFKADAIGSSDEVKWDLFGAGVAYSIAEGLSLGADIIHVNVETDDDDADATIFLVGTILAF